MRSQIEIKEKIDKLALFIRGHKGHPFFYQYKILVFKLYWEEAKKYLKVEDQNDMRREQWKKTSSLDYKILKEEIFEQLDIAAMHVQSKAKIEAMLCAVILLAQFWLLGSKKDKALEAIWKDFSNDRVVDECYESIFMSMAQELQINWERLKLRYAPKEESPILDSDGVPFQKEGDYEQK